jgi:N-acetylmuramoyl-L-alanine amidase
MTILVPALSRQTAHATPIWSPAFEQTWGRTDKPVENLQAQRTWMWGPEPYSAGIIEPYTQATGGKRIVQYFDKSRMEITTDKTVSLDSPWYVTNGLLATELITGRVQVGDSDFWNWEPAMIPVAGDGDDSSSPTYATFTGLLTAPPAADGALLTTRVARNGSTRDDPSLASEGVTAAFHVNEWGANHQVASVFWDFMHAEGLVYEDGQYQQDSLFESPFYATGFPITEAYWATVALAGVQTDVLMQCFERRCLTYTPTNPKGWEVEAGNIGQHYFRWRYSDNQPVPAPIGQAPVIVLDAGHDASSGGAIGVEYRDTLATALATRDALEGAGYTVYLTRTDDTTMLMDDASLLPPNVDTMEFGYGQGYAHATKALQFNPDLFISLHYNGSDDPDAAGMTVYYCDYGGDQNARLAGLVRDALLDAFHSVGYDPLYARAAEDGEIGKVYGHLATLGNVYNAPFAFEGNRLTGIPAVLTEPLFETNPTERALVTDPDTIDAFAQGYLHAVNAYFGR